MISYGKQNISDTDIDAVRRILEGDWITQGPMIPAFEECIATYVGASQCIAVSNGTAALHLAYLAAGISSGDEIIMPANTFVATANAALYIGARPVFADIDPLQYNINPTDIERCITSRTKAIVVVHFAGHPCSMDRIFQIAKEHRLVVIEDAAHALGAQYHGTPVGGLPTFAATFSFHPVKSITTGEGGMVATSSLEAASFIRLLRSHGVTKDTHGKNVMTALGFNYRLTDFQAALGFEQMKKIEDFIRIRHSFVHEYETLLRDLDMIQLPIEDPDCRSAWHLYVIRVREKKDRDPLYQHLLDAGIGANFHYPSVYSHPYYRRHGYADTSLPETDRYTDTCITLPLHTKLTQPDIQTVSDALHSFFSH
ncbi:MAG: DegT/DnrJ/EryC1/StrS family aminotransferase [bacterium]